MVGHIGCTVSLYCTVDVNRYKTIESIGNSFVTCEEFFPSAFIGNTNRIYRKFLLDKLQRNFI